MLLKSAPNENMRTGVIQSIKGQSKKRNIHEKGSLVQNPITSVTQKPKNILRCILERGKGIPCYRTSCAYVPFLALWLNYLVQCFTFESSLFITFSRRKNMFTTYISYLHVILTNLVSQKGLLNCRDSLFCFL